jgi:hypothetical protein
METPMILKVIESLLRIQSSTYQALIPFILPILYFTIGTIIFSVARKLILKKIKDNKKKKVKLKKEINKKIKN